MKVKKATQKELELHNSIINRNDVALLLLYDLYGAGIIRTLKSWYPKLAAKNDDSIPEAVNEAFLGYYNNPATFNSEINSLERFLEIAAERDLKNIIEKEKKQKGRVNLPEDVELQDKYWNSIIKDTTAPDQSIIHKEMMKILDKELNLHFKTNVDITLAKMVLSCERNAKLFAEVLGITELPVEQQEKEVKRHKDRIKKIIERHKLEESLKKLTQ